ncbi:MAG: LamG-like jellyroll fold domain-containing protein [Acidobacteriota bacterium]
MAFSAARLPSSLVTFGWIVLALVAALAVSWLNLTPADAGFRPAAPTGSTAPAGAGRTLAEAALGPGWVAWESNREGEWRIYRRSLDGSPAERLSPEDPGWRHCCPHISPEGDSLVYLRFRPGGPRPWSGELMLQDVASGESRRLAAARVPSEHRVALWRSSEELIFIGADGHTALLQASSGEIRPLTGEPHPKDGWIVNAPLTFATSGVPDFSPFEAATGEILPRQPLGGCQPYFSADGRWGFWIAGAGGPVRQVELATGTSRGILDKGDHRLPPDRGYLYFPMLSRDQSLLAWGASGGEHDFQQADYDVWLAEVDPESLELVGPPVAVSEDPATDRFPDVYRRPLALGRHGGEAPVIVDFAAPRPARWDFGDGLKGEVRTAARHTFEAAGSYRVIAETPAGERFEGQVRVRSRKPPQVTGLRVVGPRRLEVSFDEPVRVAAMARIFLASDLAVAGRRLDESGRRLILDLAADLEAADTLNLAGILDRAVPPNEMAAVSRPIPAPRWPAGREALAFLWRDGSAPNLVPAPSGAGERTFVLRARGEARIDGRGAMRPSGGYFESAEAGGAIRRAAQGANRLSFEVRFVPLGTSQPRPRTVVALGAGRRGGHLAVTQEGDRLVLRLRTAGRNRPVPPVELFPVAAGEAVHLTVTFEPGALRAYRDGHAVDLGAAGRRLGDFFHWRDQPLRFGEGWAGNGVNAAAWTGAIDAVAFYGRVLSPAEVAESHRRLDRETATPVAAAIVEAELVARSPTPSLDEITPYDRALAVYEYRILRRLAGRGVELTANDRLRVAHWVLLDGRSTREGAWTVGQRARLRLEPFAANPQLEGRYLADEIDGPGPLYFAARPLVEAAP